ncbi:B-lectin domain-containing protein [Naegleria gruberi]|uniref:B-lectin domain-containing protein n=1 Tax=Naegleria gruberi TaxID=5762 RepID=D2VTE9_NAEGR|nr:B-lectin domain-containing protein [Naegleria gruberi]EFC39850.1 B-lectin domain-containing protein [Naegleria gruberi]|eukprot:XP_002672594.1 B-lectin domain-containing protein [Naegleria gruberi strain NEG-M]
MQQPHSRTFLYLLFILILQVCLQVQQHSTTLAVNTCWGYSATDISNVCGGHGFCQSTDSCYCVDSTSSNTLYSSGGSNTLYQETSLWSTNSQFELKQQNDGNLVVYTRSGGVVFSFSTWQQTPDTPYTLVLSGDGTLQVKSGGGAIIKTISGACGGTAPYKLLVQNDGNIVLYGAQREVCFASGTSQGGYSLTYNWGGDQCNQYLCYGLTGANACNGHGSCNSRDSCSCNNGYSGSQCTEYYCNSVLYSQIGTVCNGHGTCTAPNTCQCTGGYNGTFCASYQCYGFESNDPGACSGFGTCSSPNTCTNCLAGRYGSECQYYDCGGIRFDQPNVCSGRGECGSKNNCTCSEPYFGDNCENFMCNGIINNSTLVCSGHGACSSPENCTCQEGYFGENCELFECSGILKNESNVCTGFGNCTAFDSCQCDEQHYGKFCEINICNGVLSNSPSVCSSHGQCNSFNNCTCDENYSGQNCEIYDCYGASKNSSSVCSGRGTCSAYNNCSCSAPFYGSDCGLYNCFGVEHLNDSSCSSHGSCDSPNNCTCKPGYYGNRCEFHNCYGTLFNSSGVCSTHGQCLSPNNCFCEAGFYGPECAEYDCFGVHKNSSNVCFQHGACLSPNNCSCQEGYFSFDCSNHRCYGYLFNDTTNVCNGHGSCPYPNNCTCQSGYYGYQCESHECFGKLFNISTVCSTHGQCLSPNNCFCEAGYYGPECAEYDCFGVHKNSSNVCFQHGTCLSPNNCSCQEGYYGFDCSNHNCFGILFNDTMNVCNGHGSCFVPDNCTCHPGYYGKTCEMHNCFNILFNDSNVCSGKGQCLSPNNCSCVDGFTNKDCSVNISPFQINLTKYEEVVYLEFDNKTISVEIQLTDRVLSQSPNISYTWSCAQCDGQNVVYYVDSNRLFINSTLTDVTQAGNYTFIANASIANIQPFQSRKSNIEQFKLVVKYDLNQPTLGSFGLPSVLVSNTQDQTISTVINSITLNQTTVRYFLGCGRNCSTLVSYLYEVKAGVFYYKKSGSVMAQFESSNLLTFSPSVPIQATIPSDYLNETVSFTFTVINNKQQNISSTVQIQIVSSASPPTRLTNIVDVVPTYGISMSEKFTIKVSEWVASPELLPLKYAFGYFDKSKAEAVRLTEYGLNTTFSSYLPYIRSSSSSKARSILEATETIALVVFVQDSLGNVETETAANVTVSPFNGTQEQYIEVVKSLSGESLLVASVDQTFTSLASSSLVSALISNIEIDPKNPSSSLSSLETLTSNNETLTANTVTQVINKLDSFISNLTELYLSELALYGYVKSGMSSTDISKTVQIISNCFSTSYDAEKTKSTASLVTGLIYYGTIPSVVDTTSTELPTTSYKSTSINITVSSFNMPTPSTNLQSVSDTESKVAMNLTSILSKYGAYSTTCGATMIIYSKNTNYDSSVSNMTISSSVTDFKFMRKLDILVLKNLDSPLILSFNAATIPSSVIANSTVTNSTYHCKYWDESLKLWSSNGCLLNRVSSNSIECACSHTTMFTTFLESKTTALTVQLKDQVSSLYYAQISFGIIYLIAASAILVGLIVLRKSQPVSSRLLTPYVGLIALIVECTLIYIVQRSVLVDQLNSANTQMWENGDTAANIIANIVMIIVNTLNLTAIFCYVMQVFRFQFMKLLYKKLSDNRTQAQSATVLKVLKYTTSQILFYSLIGIFTALNIAYWVIWVILRRTGVLTSTQYTYVVSLSYTVCILAFGLIITAVAILDMILSSKKEVEQKKNRRKAINFSQPTSNFSLDNAENVHEKKKINRNVFLNAFNWFTSMDGPLYFRMEMFIYIVSFILLILNQVIGLSSLAYRFESLTMFKLALTFDSISFIFEVLYVVSYILVFGGYALIVAIIYKVRQRRTRKEEQKKQNEEIMNQELYNTLESEEGYELFANFCEKEFSSENLFLFSDIKASPDVASGENLGGLLFFAERIYEKYIKTGAEMEVNIPSKSRTAFVQLYEKCKKVETNSSLELLDSNSLAKSGIETNIVKDCFDLMMRQVVMNLGDTFSRFVFTPEYVNFKAVRDVQMQIIEKANVVYDI